MQRIEHLDYAGAGYTAMTPDELLAAGVPQAAIDAYLAGIRRDAIRAECARRIYSTASQATQSNMNAAATVIAGKPVSARSDAEKAVMAGLEAALQWVGAMRANVATLTTDPSTDYQADASWPTCPAPVVALVSQF